MYIALSPNTLAIRGIIDILTIAESNCNDIMDTNIFYIIQLLPIIEALDMM